MPQINVDDVINELAGKIGQLEAQNAVLRAQNKALQEPKEEPEKEE